MVVVVMSGTQVGGVIFGGLSDRLGRKWIMLLCLYRSARPNQPFKIFKGLL